MELSSNRAVARIFLNNIVNNIKEYKKIRQDKNTKICAVVKADAYGHGSIKVTNYIQDYVDYFAVSTGDEAIEIRENGIKKPILILGYVSDNEIKHLIEDDIYFTVYNLDTAKKLSIEAAKQNKIANIHIKLDTGMSRIGFLSEDDYVSKIKKIQKMDNIKIRGCFSHFACADEKENPFTDIQFEKFLEMTKNLEKNGIDLGIKHIANSSASESSKYDLDMIRLGIGIYGYSISDKKNDDIKLKPAMRLESMVSNMKYLKKGSTVSYSRRYKLDQDSYIATLPIGYADGVIRALSNKSYTIRFEGNRQGTIVGNICMDQMMVKTNQEIPCATKAYLFGYDNESGYEISALAGTIIDEMICAVKKRVKRQYETQMDNEDI